MKDLAGKCAVITGAGSGIGRGMACAFAEAGMDVVVSDIDFAAANETCSLIQSFGTRCLAVQTDVSNHESVQELASISIGEFNSVSVLCNNAGVCLFGDVAGTSRDDWQWLVNVNILGVAWCLEAFLPHMLEQARDGCPGHIVNTASSAGLYGTAGVGAYTATKFAVAGLTESLRDELQGTGLGVSLLCPAAVSTAIHSSDRNRPPELGGGGATVQPSEKYVKEKGMDPAEVGKLVLEAVRSGDFYIFSHPSIRKSNDQRFENLDAAFSRWQSYFEG